jgi:hypothetical protein
MITAEETTADRAIPALARSQTTGLSPTACLTVEPLTPLAAGSRRHVRRQLETKPPNDHPRGASGDRTNSSKADADDPTLIEPAELTAA